MKLEDEAGVAQIRADMKHVCQSNRLGGWSGEVRVTDWMVSRMEELGLEAAHVACETLAELVTKDAWPFGQRGADDVAKESDRLRPELFESYCARPGMDKKSVAVVPAAIGEHHGWASPHHVADPDVQAFGAVTVAFLGGAVDSRTTSRGATSTARLHVCSGLSIFSITKRAAMTPMSTAS